MLPPDLFRVVRRLEIRTRGLVENLFGGEYHTAFKGRGIAFSEVRPYQIGDDVRTIDWNVSARTGETYVKVFEEEREQTLMLAVDVSGSGLFGSGERLKHEVAAELCAVLAFSAIKNNDRVGLLLFSDSVEATLPPQKGRRHVLRLVRDLYAHEPTGHGTRIAVAIEHLLHILKHRSIVFIVSDFLDKDFERPLRVLARRHDVIPVWIRDPREEALPDVGMVRLQDAETGTEVLVDTSSRAVRMAWQEAAGARKQEVSSLFKRLRLDPIPIDATGNYVDPLMGFFRRRNKEARLAS